MRFAPPVLLFVATVLPLGLRAEDVTKVDASKQNTQLAPSGGNDSPLAPSRDTNQRTFLRNDRLQEQRFNAPDMIQRKDSELGSRRAPIDLTEKKDKTVVDRKKYPEMEIRDRELSPHDGEKSRIQPEGDQILKYGKADRFQNRMTDAETAAAQRQPKLEKRTTFEKINRFIFKRNGPGTEDGEPMVKTAGGPAPAMQDTHTTYKFDWGKAKQVQPSPANTTAP